MPVHLEPHVEQLVRLGANLLRITESEFIERAIHALAPPRGASSALPEDPWEPIPLYAEYAGRRIAADYIRATRRLTVRSGPLAGTTYKSPSAAGRAVIADLNQNRAATQVNGWRFWRLADTHQRLSALR